MYVFRLINNASKAFVGRAIADYLAGRECSPQIPMLLTRSRRYHYW